MRMRGAKVLGAWVILASCILVSSCEKEVRPCPSSSSSPDGRDQFVGQYKVYDTTGTLLYNMEIMKANDPGNDLVYVVNWGGRFDLYVQHDDGDLTAGLNLAPTFPSFDHEGNRWAFFPVSDAVFQSGYLINDTLRMSYEISNIAFYAQDGVPFFEWSYWEYGVKQ